MNLYELSHEYCEALNVLHADLESGAIDEATFFDTLEGMEGDVETKMLNTARYIATLDAEAGAIKAVEEARKSERQRAEKRADSLRGYLARHCAATGIVPKAADIAIALRKSEAVAIDDETALPTDYLREIPATTAPDKALIKQAIKDGFAVPGAHIETRHSVTIK